jgi:ligand-binding SRPBCC domain-containing protein
VRGSVKYGSTVGCTAELLSELNLPAETAQSLASLGNLGVAKSTWSAYKTAKAMVDKCQSETKTDLTLPFDQKKTLIFIDW